MTSSKQKAVLVDIISWIKDGKSGYLTMGGYAGTGKTYLIVMLRKILQKMGPKMRVRFCAYTGKATRVLKGYLHEYKMILKQDSISTIHSLIYAPITNRKGVVTAWKKKEEIEADLIIVDEASMIDENLWSDLLSFQVPILAVGDHGQLPPINSDFNLMKNPVLKLEEIHRQEKNNPIIQMSMIVRETGKIELGKYGNNIRKIDRYDNSSGQEVEEMLQRHNHEMMILTGFNNSRKRLNDQIRQYLGIYAKYPRAGDRLICLKNNWDKGIYNGMIGSLQRIIPNMKDGVVDHFDVDVFFEEDDHYYSGSVAKDYFIDNSGAERKNEVNKHDLFDYGYALTVHKAQGSQSKEVLLFEERSKYMSDDNWRRWLYTGITRAEKYLTIVGN